MTPIQLTAQRVQWSEAGLEIAADAKFATGPALGVDLFMHDKTVVLRRATLKDRDSDAVFTFAKRDSLIEAGFAGVFAGQSLAALFGHAAELHAGRISGDFQLTLNLDQQRRSTAHGKLFGEQIDLNNIFALPIKLEHVDLQADDEAVHVRDLRIDWAEQKATLRGDIARQGDGFALALEVATQSFVLDALRSPSSEPTAKQATATTQTNDTTFDPWSLPITGTVVLRADSLEYKHRRAEGVRALITLQEESATLAVTDASLCGMSMPLTLHATPQEYNASVQLAAKNQSLSGFTQCLEGKQISVSGQFDLAAALSTKGKTDKLNQSLIQNLSGAIEFHAYDGEIRKLALLGNILSLKSVSDLVKGQVNLKEAGFKYRDIAVRSKVRDGTVKLEQAALDSAALGIATTGTINLDNYESQLTVLVAPFGRLDRIMRNVPIVGYIMGGAMTSIPVGVSGDIRNPIVVPLGPSAVGAELLGIFERTFKLPGKLVEPLSTTPTK